MCGVDKFQVIRLLLNKRNAASMEQVLGSLTEAASLDSGAVRKVFTLSGQQVTSLPQFFSSDDIFFVYGNERYQQEDFELEFEESKVIQQSKRTPGLRNGYVITIILTRGSIGRCNIFLENINLILQATDQ